jgi:hypothetical protein
VEDAITRLYDTGLVHVFGQLGEFVTPTRAARQIDELARSTSALRGPRDAVRDRRRLPAVARALTSPCVPTVRVTLGQRASWRVDTLQSVELEEWRRWWKTRGAQELRALLMEYWDPIRVNGIPEASDEYDGYLGPLARKLREGTDARGVAEYLSEVQTVRMELPATPDQLAAVGDRVLEWYAVEMRR